MKKTYLRRCFSKHPASIIAIIISQFTLLPMVNAVEISINGSDDLKLVGGITYDFQSTPRTISFQVDTPFVCTSIDATNALTVLGVNDANNVPITTLNGGILAYEHNLNSDRINIITDGSIQCAGQNGFQNEVVLKHGFESSDLKITFLDTNGDIFPVNIEVSDQQTFVYQYIVENTGDVTLGADLVEFFKVDASQPFFSDAPGDDWVCSISGGTTTSCGDVASGEATVNLTNAVVEPGEQLSIIVTRVVEIPTGTVGTNIELLSAIFVTDGDDNATNNNSIFQVFGTTDNNQPTISTMADTTIFEDASTSVIGFTVTDVETDDGSLLVTATSSSNSVVSPANIVLGGTGSNRTIQITPTADANTAVLPVTITVTVDDGITTVNEQFELTVTPVNDMPVFTLKDIPDWPAGTLGLKTLKGFVENLSLGASANEGPQSIINSTVVIQSDPNGIFAVGGEPQLTNNGVITYFLSGVGGDAILDVELQDDGGTDNGGVDTSATVSLTLTVLNTLPVISAVSNEVFDEDNSSSVITFTVSDAETAANALVMSATSSDESIIQISGIQFSGTGTNRTVQVTPVADQNTAISGDVVITLIVDDGSNTSETSFNVSINPINDAPTFDIGEDIIWPIGTVPTGFIQQAGFASNIQMGPTTDENTQVVDEFIETISGDAIFVTGFFPAIDENGGLAYALNGTVSGVAIVEVVLKDDGGVLNGGVDLSMKRTFRIVVQQ